MKNSDHLASIILPIHNASKFLKDSLQSVLAQTHKNIEIIAIDDRSSDTSYKILKDFKKRDKRLRLYRNKKHYGLSVSLNRAVMRAKGQFISFMGAKDITERQRIKTQIEFLQKNPKVVAVGSQCMFISKYGRPIGRSNFPIEHSQIKETLLAGLSILPLSVTLNRKLLPKDVLKFRQNPYPFIYIDVFLKLLQYGQFANIKAKLYLNRKKNVGLKDAVRTYIPSFIKLWFQSSILSDSLPTFRSLFLPLVKQI